MKNFSFIFQIIAFLREINSLLFKIIQNVNIKEDDNDKFKLGMLVTFNS